MKKNKHYALKRLFYARLLVTAAVFLSLYWLNHTSTQQPLTLYKQLFFLWLALFSAQLLSFHLQIPKNINVFIQLLSDLILIGFIIYHSGGYASPFIFLLGIVIIAAGTQASILLSLIMAVLASATYILSIYSSSNAHYQPISSDQALKLLLQTSLFFLVGGIMALISRRHANLEQKQKDTTTQHKQLQEIHSQVLQSMQEGIITLNSDLSIQAFNPAAAHFLGLAKQHAGFKVDSFIHIPDALHEFSRNDEADILRHEINWHGNDLLLTFTKLQHSDQSSWLMTIVNITETRSLERQLAEQDKLASIGQMAAMLAHEIRNPMQTIAQATELMGLHHQDTTLERIITSEIHRLNRLVSDMLDYANPLHPHTKPLRIKSFIQKTLQQIDLNQAYDIQTNIEDTTLVLDPDHLRLVLDNLLRNAIRVSPEPASISVTLAIVDDAWMLQVKDQGLGIEEHMKDTLFQPFQTGHKQGTGLGLATVWQVCQANSWQVSIDEALTTGACFIVKGATQPTQDKGEEEHG
jgi:signal transduction histidine kinase